MTDGRVGVRLPRGERSNPHRDARIAALRGRGTTVRDLAGMFGTTQKAIYYALWRHRDRSEAGGPTGKGQQPASDLPPSYQDRFAWLDDAACKDQPVDVFFWGRDAGGAEETLAPPGYYDRALRICAMCPVRQPCFEFGYKERFGVWGGTTRWERRYLGQARAWKRSQGRMLRAFRGQEVGEDKW